MATEKEIIQKVKQMRIAQRNYYSFKVKTLNQYARKNELLAVSKALEKEVDQMIIDHEALQTKLF